MIVGMPEKKTFSSPLDREQIVHMNQAYKHISRKSTLFEFSGKTGRSGPVKPGQGTAERLRAQGHRQGHASGKDNYFYFILGLLLNPRKCPKGHLLFSICKSVKSPPPLRIFLPPILDF